MESASSSLRAALARLPTLLHRMPPLPTGRHGHEQEASEHSACCGAHRSSRLPPPGCALLGGASDAQLVACCCHSTDGTLVCTPDETRAALARRGSIALPWCVACLPCPCHASQLTAFTPQPIRLPNPAQTSAGSPSTRCCCWGTSCRQGKGRAGAAGARYGECRQLRARRYREDHLPDWLACLPALTTPLPSPPACCLQYAPWLGMLVLKRVGPARVRALREGRSGYDVGGLMRGASAGMLRGASTASIDSGGPAAVAD